MFSKARSSEDETTDGLAEKIIELTLCTRKASATSEGALGLKEGLLFCLLKSPLPPRELMDALGMAKSNLALLAKKCIDEGLITKTPNRDDRRALTYSITEKGREDLNKRTAAIEKKFATVVTDDKQREEAHESLDNALQLLSYL